MKTSNSDLVTIHDQQTEEALIRLLSEAVPDSRFTGEEGGSHGEGLLEWIIDPIDGTSNFAHGFDHFSVSIGAAIDDVVVAGVVHDPINELTFSADDDAAYLSTRDASETVLASAPKTGTAEPHLNLLTNFPAHGSLPSTGPRRWRCSGIWWAPTPRCAASSPGPWSSATPRRAGPMWSSTAAPARGTSHPPNSSSPVPGHVPALRHPRRANLRRHLVPPRPPGSGIRRAGPRRGLPSALAPVERFVLNQ